MPMIYKSLPVETALKDLDTKQGIVTGYLSAYGIPDDGPDGDTMMPGVFKKSLKERGPLSSMDRMRYLRQHDPLLMLGRFQVLREDQVGLYFESKILLTSYGRDTLTLYEGGAINEHSIGFNIVNSKRNKDGCREITEGSLWEGSAVTWGMNPHTPTLSVKDACGGPDAYAQTIERMGRIEKLLRRGNLQDDDLCVQLELQLKQWQSLLAELAPADNTPEREVITVTTNKQTLLEEQLQTKASDLVANLQQTLTMDEIRSQRWKLRYAFDDVVDALIGNKTLTVEQKLAAFDESMAQYAELLRVWMDKYLTLLAAINGTATIAVTAAQPLGDLTTKSLVHNIDSLKALLLAQGEPSSPDTPAADPEPPADNKALLDALDNLLTKARTL